MKARYLPCTAAVALALVNVTGVAQTVTRAPLPSASAPVAARSEPTRAAPVTQLRDSAFPTEEEQAQGKVIPQLSFPIGKKAAAEPLKALVRPERPASPASSYEINDSAARCEATATQKARAKCRPRPLT